MSKLAVQLWTVRSLIKTASGFASTLEKIADIGYEAIQINGDHPELNAGDIRKILDLCGLQCIATHRDFERFQDYMARELDFHRTLGCQYAAIGGLGRGYLYTYDGCREFCKDVRPIIEQLQAEGIRFGYHNHSHEFVRPQRCGKTLEDIFIDEGPEDLMMELDLYWINHAGVNCERIIERCHGRVPVVHLKDKEVDRDEGPRMAPIGEGNMDWDHIIPACEAAGVEWYCIEQDHCYRDPIDCLKSSFDYLSGKGL